jgi:hypothetical protein
MSHIVNSEMLIKLVIFTSKSISHTLVVTFFCASHFSCNSISRRRGHSGGKRNKFGLADRISETGESVSPSKTAAFAA